MLFVLKMSQVRFGSGSGRSCGSTDKLRNVRQAYGARITKIKKEEFSFGRSQILVANLL